MALHFVHDGAGEVREGDELRFTGTEAHHAAVVRRVRVGEPVTATDGRGTWLIGTCATVAPQEVVVSVLGVTHRAAPTVRTVLAQALAKSDRDELAVQAATELGVDEVVPWQANRSISRWVGAKAVKGRARWQSIVREASKQAHRAWIAEVSEPVSTRELSARAERAMVLVLDPWSDAPLSEVDLSGATEIVLVVGPEGGIAPDELDLLVKAGATRVRLGETVLRTSTAGPAALAVLNTALGRW